jgi:GAF domain-containing protein/HAMP domain-containing protein
VKTRHSQQSHTISLRSRLVLSFALLAFLAIGISLAASYINYRQQNRADLRQRLLNIVSLAALQQNGDIFAGIKSPDDPAFEQIRIQNLRIRSSDPDLAFVYTMRFDTQGIYFVVDAVEPGDPLGSAYGERYSNPGPVLAANYTGIDHPIAENNFYTDEYGTFLSAYAPFYTSDNQLAGIIGVDISASKILAKERQTLFWFISIFALSLPIVGAVGWFLGDRLAAPISTLTQAAIRISEGELDYRPGIITTSTELVLLGKAFYSMADQLRSLISSLEQRITERTQALERRASQLQASADIGVAATRIRDLGELLRQATRLIGQRFGFYHVGIFLLDNAEEYAVLRATNSEGGQRMLARGHKLKIGQVGIVGYVTGSGQARIALDVGKDAAFFNNPDLPETHSEMALPLIVGGKTLGALDVQSTKEMAFTDEDIRTLTVLANQIAIAIENARLFANTQAALEAASHAYGDISRLGWQNLLSEHEAEIGYISFTESNILPVEDRASPEFLKTIRGGQAVLTNEDLTLHLPIKVRGNVIGAIRLDKQKGRKWSADDISTANNFLEQLGAALESARLYDETSRRAVRERLLGEISTKIGASSQRDTILRTAVEELGRAIPGSEVVIQFQDYDEAAVKQKKT